MSGSFSLVPEWEPTQHGPDEVRQTSGFLRISIGNRLVTQVVDDWARSVRDTVRVSCYPLALWFASSWWRLCWEQAPNPERSTDWALSHEMHGAGHGFLWPVMRFESDGERVSIICRASTTGSNEPVRYLTSCRESIPVEAFMEAVTTFIHTVLARLEIVGIQNTELHTLWREVNAERGERQSTFYRKLEAFLGFDPDDAPEVVASKLLQLSPEAGEAAIAEIAVACAGRSPSLMLSDIEKSIFSRGVAGDLSCIPVLTQRGSYQPSNDLPRNRGRAMAQTLRAALDNRMDPIADQRLCDLFGLRLQDLNSADAPMDNTPWGLAIRQIEGNHVHLLFRRKHLTGRRFEMARWLGDMLAAPLPDRWLPATDAKSARQQMQRAFAAELLAPIEALQSFLGDEPSDEERIEESAHYFGVSPLMVKSHLANHGLLSPEAVEIY
ncbi:MAG: hypothetical protein HQM06_01820 [Magnetococcales bacterium]|nr:hypothetical protein [Magnetococcales bacterium]